MLKKLRQTNFLGFYNVIEDLRSLKRKTKIFILISILIFFILGAINIQELIYNGYSKNIWFEYTSYYADNTYIKVRWINVLLQSMNIFSTITGFLAVALVAHKAISSFFWSMINVTTYALYAFNFKFLGDFQIMLFVMVPTLLFGWYNWQKSEGIDFEDKAKINTIIKKILLVIIISIGLIVITVFWRLELEGLYKIIGDNSLYPQSIWLDAFTTAANTIGIILQSLKSQSQWLIWLLVNVFTIIKYLIPNQDSFHYDFAILLQYIIYTIICIYGIYNWYFKNKKSKLKNNL